MRPGLQTIPWPILLLVLLLIVIFRLPSAFASLGKVIIAEASYTMTDGDTLTSAEEKVLQRAQRKAIEEAGVYLEATFLDIEREFQGQRTQNSMLEIRTIAAGIAETEILESRRSFENDRPVFFIRIRATVDIDSLLAAIRRQQSEEKLSQHFRQLQQENQQLRKQLKEFQQDPVGVRMLVIEPNGKSEPAQQAGSLVSKAVHSQNLREKIQLSSEAIVLDSRSVEPLLIRGQTYLRLVSLAFAQHSNLDTYADYLQKAQVDFDRALQLDNQNAWGWVGKGDVQTWFKQMDDAAVSYEQALALDPFFDIARQRLIVVYTTQARRQAESKHPHQALATLKRLLDAQTPDSWIPYQKEAYMLRSDILLKLNRPGQAIEDLSTVIRVDPTNTGALLTRAKLYQNQLQGRLAKDDLERACVLGSIEACEQLP